MNEAHLSTSAYRPALAERLADRLARARPSAAEARRPAAIVRRLSPAVSARLRAGGGAAAGIAAWALVLARVVAADRVAITWFAEGSCRWVDLHGAGERTAGQWLAEAERGCGAAMPAEADPDGFAWCDGPADRPDDAPPRAAFEAGFVDAERFAIRVDTSRYAGAAAAGLADMFEHLLAELLREPAQPLAAIAAISAARLEALSGAADRLAAAFPVAPTVPERIAAQAARRPQAIAVRCEGESLTYDALNRRANRLAHHLRSLGVGAETLVAVGLTRSTDMVVALLGILKSGGAYLPIDLAYPADRIEFTLADARAAVVVTDRASAAALPASEAVTVIVEDLPASAEDHEPAPCHGPDSLAYVIYTSGSTGKPKGCQVTHANVMRLFTATAHWFGFGEDDVFSFFHSHAFDFSVWEIWGALVHGGCVVVVPYLVSRSPRDFHALLCRERVTVLNQTPSAFRALIQADQAEPDSPARLALRTVIFGGEALELQMLAPWFDKHGDAQPRLVNMYGITETTVHVTYRPIARRDLDAGRGSVIGAPIPDLAIFLLDERGRPVAPGVSGEIHVAGAGVSRGYLRRPELNRERFIDWPAPDGRRLRLYRSGDLAHWLEDGDIEYLGRADHQVKVRGFRIETGEIESQLARCADVRGCAVLALPDASGEARLVAYIVPGGPAAAPAALRAQLARALPAFMLPSAFVQVAALPLTENGKLDRRALPLPGRERPALAIPYAPPQGALETRIAAAIAEVLALEEVGRHDGFFDLGGSSLQAVEAAERLSSALGQPVSEAMLFSHASPAALAAALLAQTAADTPATAPAGVAVREPIAIIGMACRVPGADSVEAFWQALIEGRDTVTRFAEADLDPSIPAALRGDPAYVSARGVIADVDRFDADLFGIPQREAEVTDPQQRVFLELAHECLERAGYAPDRIAVPVGVFAGVGTPSYLQAHVLPNRAAIERVGELAVQLGNDKDYVATRVAFRLGLKGPAINVNTACSTSLVAVAQAVDSLRLGRCRMALAGAASVTCPPRSGYLHQDGAMLSSDGRTRTFDAQADGTVFNDGAAVLLLKRLSDALADGDVVHAVIRAVAVNNDGGGKASFSAPSVDGQADVIAAAHDEAGIDPRAIDYLEAHGTATPLGDPVEVEALTRAFRRRTADTGFCRIGSVKSNVGHLVTAAGAAGLIKTVLALGHERLPATLHYTRPNPKIAFERSPFVVVAAASAWPRGTKPRLAGVSSFGVGGTNAHAIVEEAPRLPQREAAAGAEVLRLSARSTEALERQATDLAAHLRRHPDVLLADVAYTLAVGRRRHPHRLAIAAADRASAVAALEQAADPWRVQRTAAEMPGGAVWLFPGQGAQYAAMGRGLHAAEPVFRAAFDACLAAMAGHAPADLRARIFEGGADALRDTAVTQPALFCLEVALARLWLARGHAPAAMIGHSVGEFAAAVIAGVMSLDDGARLVACRGALMQALPAGRMLSVRLGAAELASRLPAELAIAADNAPEAAVAAGPADAIAALAEALQRDGIATRELATSHAFHSPMMDGALAPFRAALAGVRLAAPQFPIFSTLTGRALTARDATDPEHWARHLRETVRFAPAVRCALDAGAAAFLEVGPRATLGALVRQQRSGGVVVAASLADDVADEPRRVALAEAALWAAGIEAALPERGERRRVLLPTPAFERRRCWLDAPPALPAAGVAAAPAPNPSPSVPEVPMTVANAPSGAGSPRRAQLAERARVLIEDVAGIDIPGEALATPFVELGLDSLMLTQAAIKLKKEFGVALSFRQLMQELRSIDRLAEFVDAALPAPAQAPADPATAAMPVVAAPALVMPVAVPLAAPVVPAMPADAPFVQQIIQQQMHLMAQQLALLGGTASMAPRAAIASMPAVEVPPPAVAAAVAPAAADDRAPMRYDVKKAFGAIARIHTQSNALTPRQQARLEAFVERYVERTAKSKAYTTAHRGRLADPRVVNGFRPLTKEIVYQIVVAKSKGSHLWDIDGNDYVDVLNGFGMCLFGWQPDFVQEAVRRQLEAGYEIGPMSPLAGEVADLMCELTGFDRAGLCNTGSEAVMAAVRIARTVTGRSTVVLFTGSYHGTFDEVLVRAGREGKGLPAAPGIMSGMFGDVRVLDYGTPEALEFIRSHADDLAAVLVEPVQSRRPDFQPREFLAEVRRITEQSGTCLIFDEVITGFRAHLGGTQAMFGIRADLASYGKVIGGGFPVGVIAGKREYMDALDGGAWQYGDDSMPTVGVTYFAGTFVRHPLALAAAKASLEHLKREGPALQEQLNLRTAAMADELNAACREVGAPVAVRHFSSLWRITFLEDHPLQDLLFAMMRSRGVHILDNFPCFLTTAHTVEDIARIKTAFRQALLEMQESEFLPRRAPAAAVDFDASRPPVPGARLGRDADGKPAWFVANPAAPGKYMKVESK